MQTLTRADHERATFRNCRRVIAEQNRIGCGGRVFWQEGEPKWSRQLGLVGVCCHCGWQVFTADLTGALMGRACRAGFVSRLRRVA